MNEPISSILGGRMRLELLPMSWEGYRAIPAMNGSVLVHGRKSLRHLKHAWDADGYDTDAMQFGRLLHCLLFEPAEVEHRWWAWEGRRAGKDWETRKDEAEAAGAEIIRATGQYSLESALVAAQSFLHDARIQALISAGQAEQTILAPEFEMQCKGRIDWVSASVKVLVDLKTAANIEPELFGKSFFRYGYDIKLGLYRRWLNAVTQAHWPVEVIVLESVPPHDVGVMPVPDAVLDTGVDKALAILRKVRQAIETDEWLGVAGNDFLPLKVPFYEMDMADELQEQEG